VRYALLERMLFERMPMSFTDPAEINELQALRAAKLLEGTFPEAARIGGEMRYEGPATVEGLTVLGRARARRYIAQSRYRRDVPK
jgi:hypothetical protein